MEDEKPPAPDALMCPICQRSLRRTSARLMSGFECEQCGTFSDFDAGSTRLRAPSSDQGSGDSGPD